MLNAEINKCVRTIRKVLQMSIEDNIENLAASLDLVVESLNPTNDFGNTVSDELHQIEYQIGRVADALEEILKRMK